MSSFQAIIRGEMPRKGENKTIVLFRSNLTFNRKFQKKGKKLKKIKKITIVASFKTKIG